MASLSDRHSTSGLQAAWQQVLTSAKLIQSIDQGLVADPCEAALTLVQRSQSLLMALKHTTSAPSQQQQQQQHHSTNKFMSSSRHGNADDDNAGGGEQAAFVQANNEVCLRSLQRIGRPCFMQSILKCVLCVNVMLAFCTRASQPRRMDRALVIGLEQRQRQRARSTASAFVRSVCSANHHLCREITIQAEYGRAEQARRSSHRLLVSLANVNKLCCCCCCCCCEDNSNNKRSCHRVVSSARLAPLPQRTGTQRAQSQRTARPQHRQQQQQQQQY